EPARELVERRAPRRGDLARRDDGRDSRGDPLARAGLERRIAEPEIVAVLGARARNRDGCERNARHQRQHESSQLRRHSGSGVDSASGAALSFRTIERQQQRHALRSKSPGGSMAASSLAQLAAAAALLSFVLGASAQDYKDARLDVAVRVEDLLARMTLEEKVAQLTAVGESKTQILDDELRFDPAKMSARYPHGIGQFARPQDARGPGSPRVAPGYDLDETIELVNAMQRHALDETRLGIPILFHEEALHGYVARGARSFPQAIALASTWDPELVRQVNAAIAREVRARGVHLVLSPVVDVARDPRWGRIEETFGEDPYLVAEMGVAAVRGLQGDMRGGPLPADKVFATLKHMTGHGQPESGANVGPAPLAERELREFFFPPFEQAVRRTGIAAVMASYNDIDGVPCHATGSLLGDVLRGEWGFRGVVVSDYSATEQLVTLHRVAPDVAAASRLALAAGVD